MEELFTKKYDSDILNEFLHFRNYPEMLPFIGSNYEKMGNKIFILGESHYFDQWVINEFKKSDEGSLFLSDWYNQNSNKWEQERKDYIYTRGNLIKIEIEKKFAKPLASYYNLRKDLGEYLDLINKEMVFSNFVYFNYFQRPAVESGESIINDGTDNKRAYDNLLYLIKLLQPDKIIFASIKGYSAFQFMNGEAPEVLKDVTIDFVPHASCRWWNTVSKKYGNRTGREKFISLLT